MPAVGENKENGIVAGMAKLRLRSKSTKEVGAAEDKQNKRGNKDAAASSTVETPAKETPSKKVGFSPTWKGLSPSWREMLNDAFSTKPAATTPVKVKKEALKPIDEAKAAADKESAGEKPKEKKGKAKPKATDKQKAKPQKAAPPADGKRQTTLYEHFAVRRSERRCSKDVLAAQKKELEDKIRRNCEDGLKVIDEGEKGLGVITAGFFARGDFVCEYAGDLIDKAEADRREELYGLEPGCYMYYFKHDNVTYCVDATKPGPIGRLINHGSKQANLQSKVIVVDGTPRLCFFATKDIPANATLQYDYGDRRKDAIVHHPWLTQ